MRCTVFVRSLRPVSSEPKRRVRWSEVHACAASWNEASFRQLCKAKLGLERARLDFEDAPHTQVLAEVTEFVSVQEVLTGPSRASARDGPEPE